METFWRTLLRFSTFPTFNTNASDCSLACLSCETDQLIDWCWSEEKERKRRMINSNFRSKEYRLYPPSIFDLPYFFPSVYIIFTFASNVNSFSLFSLNLNCSPSPRLKLVLFVKFEMENVPFEPKLRQFHFKFLHKC